MCGEGTRHKRPEGVKAAEGQADRASEMGKWVRPWRVWKLQLGPWWQSGLWEFKSKGSEVGVSPHRGMGQEGRLWLSKHPQLYLYYIFSSPGLFQRAERTVFRFPMLWPLSFISLLRLWQCLCVRSDAHPRFACKDSARYWKMYSECGRMWRKPQEVAGLFWLTCFPMWFHN